MINSIEDMVKAMKHFTPEQMREFLRKVNEAFEDSDFYLDWNRKF